MSACCQQFRQNTARTRLSLLHLESALFWGGAILNYADCNLPCRYGLEQVKKCFALCRTSVRYMLTKIQHEPAKLFLRLLRLPRNPPHAPALVKGRRTRPARPDSAGAVARRGMGQRERSSAAREIGRFPLPIRRA